MWHDTAPLLAAPCWTGPSHTGRSADSATMKPLATALPFLSVLLLVTPFVRSSAAFFPGDKSCVSALPLSQKQRHTPLASIPTLPVAAAGSTAAAGGRLRRLIQKHRYASTRSPLASHSTSRQSAGRGWQLFLAGKEDESVSEPPKKRRRWVPGQNIDKLLTKLFDKADTNKDGMISMDEIYELVLKMYINLNRQAPVPPPTRETVRLLYRKADVDGSNTLDRYEFNRLMGVIYSRAVVRIIIAKISKVVFAPLLALQTVRWASRNPWWIANVVSKIPEQYGLLLDPNLWRTVLTVFFVITLGNTILAVLNAILDAAFGVKKKLEEVDL